MCRFFPDDVGFAVVGFGDDFFGSWGELMDEGCRNGVVALDVDAFAWGGEKLGTGELLSSIDSAFRRRRIR